MKFNNFLKLHQQLNTPQQSWSGNLYLPPCTCCTSTPCIEANNTNIFDFTSFQNLPLSQLINLSNYVVPDSTTHSHITLHLCHKYSLTGDNASFVDNITDINEHSTLIQNNDMFLQKLELLKSDLKLLFPLSGSSFIVQEKNDDIIHQIPDHV